MGQLALWGAIGGIGKGLEKNIDNKRAQENAALAHERDMALRKYEAEQAAQRQQAGFGHEDVAQTREIGAREKMQGTEIDAKKEEQQSEQQFRGGEGAKNRASAEKIAGIHATATEKAAAARAAAARNGKGRWQFSSQKTDPVIGPNGEMIPGKAQQILRDSNKGLSFVQSGDRFLFPDTDPATTKRAASSEIQKLMANPDQADNFLATYKYLPAQFIAAQQSQANYAGAPQSGATPPADDSEPDETGDDFTPAQ